MATSKVKAPEYDISFVPISGTTTSAGNLEIPTSLVPATSYIVTAELGGSNYYYIGKGSSDIYYIHVMTYTGSAKASTSISGTLVVLTPRT